MSEQAKAAERKPPVVIGLLGGIAAGKSHVSRLLAERGAEVVDADRIAHEQLAEPEVIEAVAARLGEAVKGADGALDRAAIAARVFGCAPAKQALEAIIHPRVGAAILARLQANAVSGDAPRRVVVLDVPLLLEAGMDGLTDELLFVDTRFETRLERALGRGWTREQLEAREANQTPLEAKRARASWVVPNDRGAPTAASIEGFWSSRVAPRR